MGSPRHATNRRRRIREGPELACVQTLFILLVWHMQGRKDELTSCRGTVQSAWQYLQQDANEQEPGCPKRVSGRHVVRGRQSSLFLEVRARVTGKAGENGQNSGEMGGSSPWTRPSAPERGDTLKALAGDQRPIKGGDRLQKEDGSRVAVDWVTGRSYSSAPRRLNVQSGQRKGRKGAALPNPSVAVRDRGH